MRYVALILWASLSVGCLDWEEPREYDEFAEDYYALLDAGLLELDSGSGVDAGPDTGSVDMSSYTPDPAWPACSRDGGEQVEVTMVNDTGVGGALYWVDPQCEEFEIGLIPAGDELPVTTFVGHRFRLRIIRDDRRTVGGTFVEDAADTTLNLSGAP